MPTFSILVNYNIEAEFEVIAANKAEAKALAEKTVSEDRSYLKELELDWRPNGDPVELVSIAFHQRINVVLRAQPTLVAPPG